MNYAIYIDNKGYLDLPSDFSLTFHLKSTQFCLAMSNEIEDGRTDTFTLPRTERNLQFLQAFKNTNFLNNSMNSQFACTLQMNEQAYRGILYVASLTTKGFNCNFIWTSNHSELRRMGLDKKIKEWQFSDYVLYGETAVNASQGGNALFKTLKYKSKYGNILMPAINLKQLLGKCLTAQGIGNIWENETIQNGDLWAVCPSAKTLEKSKATFKRVRTSANYIEQNTQQSVMLNTISLVGSDTDLSMYTEETHRLIYYDEQYKSGATWAIRRMKGSYTALKAKMNISLTFPEDFPTDAFCASIQGDGLSQSASVFFGEYEFAWDASGLQTSGQPLAGRKINIPKGAIFGILYANDYVYNPEPFPPFIEAKRGWVLTAKNTAYTIQIEATDSEAVNGDIIRLQENLPDISIKDLWLTICASQNKIGLLRYDVLSNLPLNLDYKYVTFDIVEIQSVEKRMLDFEQKNWIKTKHEDWTEETDYVDIALTCANINLEKEHTIYEMPFADGSESRDAVGKPVLELRNKLGEETKNHIIARVGDSEYLQRIKPNLLYNAYFQMNSNLLKYKLKIKNLNKPIQSLYGFMMRTEIGLDFYILESESKDGIHTITIQVII